MSKLIHKKKKKEHGFTLVEIMIALGILSFGVLAVAAMQSTSLLGTARSSSVTIATNVAMDRMERLMSLSFDELSALSPNHGDDSDFPVTAPALPANITGIEWWVDPGPSPVQATTKKITVSVQSQDTKTPVRLVNLKITD